MIDSHCHLTASQFNADREEVIQRAIENGITKMICIADTLLESKDALALAQKFPDHIWSTAGMHPHHAHDWNNQSLSTLCSIAGHDKVMAIGEIGLDYHYDLSPRDTQNSVFKAQLQLAKDLNLPAVVHSRNAIEDTWKIITDIQPKKLVLHCCTEQYKDVQRFLHAGYFLSFTGIATFPKSDALRNTIAQCPLDQLMIETDAPYLAPLSKRGKRNEPAFVQEVAECIAQVKGIPIQDVERATTQNTMRFFTLS